MHGSRGVLVFGVRPFFFDGGVHSARLGHCKFVRGLMARAVLTQFGGGSGGIPCFCRVLGFLCLSAPRNYCFWLSWVF